MPQSSLRVLVIGAGLGGLCLAQGLRMAVASQGTPLHRALHDYEIEMLRSGFSAARTTLQAMQDRKA